MQVKSLLNFLFVSTNRFPYHYRSHRKDYYELHNDFRSHKQLYNSIVDCKKVDLPLSDTTFKPLSLHLGDSVMEVGKKIGQANFTIKKGIGDNHMVYFYRQQLGEISFLSQLHFYCEKLVIVKSTFNYLKIGMDKRKIILDAILNKYALSCDCELNSDVYFSDVQNNIIKISDNGRLNIQYTLLDTAVENALYNSISISSLPNSSKEKVINYSDLVAQLV